MPFDNTSDAPHTNSFGARTQLTTMAGRGRGRASTLPAWMTKQNDAGAGGSAPAVRVDDAPVQRGQFDDAPEPPRGQQPPPYRRGSPPRGEYGVAPRMEDRRGLSPPRQANYGGDQFNQRSQPYNGDINNSHGGGGGGGGGYHHRGQSPPRGGNGYHHNGDGFRRGGDRGGWQQHDNRGMQRRSRSRSRSRSRERGAPPPPPPPQQQQQWGHGSRGPPPPDNYRRSGRSRSRSRSRDRRPPQYDQDDGRRSRPNDWDRDRGSNNGGWRGGGRNDDYGRRREDYDRRDTYNNNNGGGEGGGYRDSSGMDRFADDAAPPPSKPSGFLSGRRFDEIVKDAARSAAEEYSSKDASGDASRSGGHDDRTRRDYRRR